MITLVHFAYSLYMRVQWTEKLPRFCVPIFFCVMSCSTFIDCSFVKQPCQVLVCVHTSVSAKTVYSHIKVINKSSHSYSLIVGGFHVAREQAILVSGDWVLLLTICIRNIDISSNSEIVNIDILQSEEFLKWHPL